MRTRLAAAILLAALASVLALLMPLVLKLSRSTTDLQLSSFRC